jgi:hypothetical protein
VVRQAAHDSDDVVKALARSITNRRPPRLLAEVSELANRGHDLNTATHFHTRCKDNLAALAQKYSIPPGLFLLCCPKPVRIEERGPLLTREDATKLGAEERDELIKVFEPGASEPKSLVDVKNTVIALLAGNHFCIQRLYLVEPTTCAPEVLQGIRAEVDSWKKPI